jgi:hypothetical protein
MVTSTFLPQHLSQEALAVVLGPLAKGIVLNK